MTGPESPCQAEVADLGFGVTTYCRTHARVFLVCDLYREAAALKTENERLRLALIRTRKGVRFVEMHEDDRRKILDAIYPVHESDLLSSTSASPERPVNTTSARQYGEPGAGTEARHEPIQGVEPGSPTTEAEDPLRCDCPPDLGQYSHGYAGPFGGSGWCMTCLHEYHAGRVCGKREAGGVE